MKSFKHVGISLLIAMLGMFAYLSSHLCIVKNISESLPFAYFLALPIKEVKKGIYVLLEHPKEPILIAKRVGGVAGDEIKIENNVIYINQLSMGYIQETSPSGSDLKPISQGRIEDDFVFVLGSHPLSFDSRYSEFGLIPTSHLRKQLWPLF